MKFKATMFAFLVLVAITSAPSGLASQPPSTQPPCDDLEELQECVNDAYDYAQYLVTYVTQDVVNDTQEIIYCVVNGCILT